MGRAAAELFAGQGARVVVNYRASKDDAETVVAAINDAGGEAIALQADVSRDAECRRLAAQTADRWGRLDYLVNNAGWSQVIPHKEFDQLTDEIWDRTLNTNVRGVFAMTRAAAQLLRESGGAVVNNASAAAFHANGSSIIYSASKAAVVNMTISLARVLAPEVRVNAVAPGAVHTRFAGWPEEMFEKAAQRSPLARIATTEEIAKAIYFLAVDATTTTAETLIVDCGVHRVGVTWR